MSEKKRYYWLKLQKDFFRSKRIKKLRSLAGGDTYTIIYLKMQLLSLEKGGILEYTGLEDSFAKELALDIDESVDNVAVTVNYLLSCGLLEENSSYEYFLPYVAENTGSETASTQRVRDYRIRQKALHCNTNETDVKRIGNAEIEKEIEIEKELEIDIEREREKKREKDFRQFMPPTLQDIKAYCLQNNFIVDPERFFDYYESNGWMVNKSEMRDWRAKVRNWEQDERKKSCRHTKQPEGSGNVFFDIIKED